jgi:hypothetical protein
MFESIFLQRRVISEPGLDRRTRTIAIGVPTAAGPIPALSSGAKAISSSIIQNSVGWRLAGAASDPNLDDPIGAEHADAGFGDVNRTALAVAGLPPVFTDSLSTGAFTVDPAFLLFPGFF